MSKELTALHHLAEQRGTTVVVDGRWLRMGAQSVLNNPEGIAYLEMCLKRGERVKQSKKGE